MPAAKNNIGKIRDLQEKHHWHFENSYSKYDATWNNLPGGNYSKKRQIINSIFSEKLCFDEKESRTGRNNEAFNLIHTLNMGFSEIQNQKAGKTLPAPDRVTLIGLTSNNFLSDLKLLASLST
jgi:hypothetical protein